MPISFAVHKAGRILRNGGVVTYPTEGVFGLGCLPEAMHAIERILSIKQRDPSRGLILIASSREQVDPWTAPGVEIPPAESTAVTWVVPASPAVPPWISGQHEGVAVRITSHPVAAALCDAVGSALVSTSANVSGHAPAANGYVLRRQLHGLVDYIVPGRCGPAAGPSEIRDLENHQTLRPAAS